MTNKINNNSKGNKILLIDASSILYRAFYALPDLSYKGKSVNLILGFFNILKSLFNIHKPNHASLIFDARDGKNTRLNIYPDYKSNRERAPESFYYQVLELKKILYYSGIKVYEHPGVEADDVLATLAHQLSNNRYSSLIASQDKDILQILKLPLCEIWDTKNNIIIDYESVVQKYGLTPGQFNDYLALLGDNVDNIPGVKGIGEKTAKLLLQTFGSLLGIYENLDKLKDIKLRNSNKIYDFLIKGKDLAFLSYKLASLDFCLDLTIDLEMLEIKDPDINVLKDSFKELGFKKLLKDLDNGIFLHRNINNKNYVKNSDINKYNYIEWNNFKILECVENNYIGILNFESGFILKCLNFYSIVNTSDKILDLSNFIILNNLLKFTTYCAKDIYKVFINNNIQIDTLIWDASIVANLIDGFVDKDIDNLLDFYTDISVVPENDTEHYIIKLEKILIIRNDFETRDGYKNKILPILKNIEFPTTIILSKMESIGIGIDIEYMYILKKKLIEQLGSYIELLESFTYKGFNFNSPNQLSEFLFNNLNLPVIKKTKKGHCSTNEEVLIYLSGVHDFPKLLLKYRSLEKLRSIVTSLINQCNKLYNPPRVFTTFQQAVTVTGRLSSINPNLQNIPLYDEFDANIRDCFKAGDDKLFLSIDYSQIELRLLAHIADDKFMIDSFNKGVDIHSEVAATIFNKNIEDISVTDRRMAKTINFGLIYGMSEFGLAKRLGITNYEAKLYLEQFFEKYPCIKKYMQKTISDYKERGIVTTMFGRYWRSSALKGNNKNNEWRSAINAPIQGSAAELIKITMINVYKWLEEKSLFGKCRLLLQIHDELLFEVNKDIISYVTPNLKNIMSTAIKLKVPLEVNEGIGKTWHKASLKGVN